MRGELQPVDQSMEIHIHDVRKSFGKKMVPNMEARVYSEIPRLNKHASRCRDKFEVFDGEKVP
jgi:hypothetical protein